MKKIRITRDELKTRTLFVASPVYGWQPYAAYSRSMEQLKAVMRAESLDMLDFQIFNESLITRARNYCVDEFMRSGMSHMLFIDSDIEFTPDDVVTLLALADPNSDKDVICGLYPKKRIRWENIVAAVRNNLFDEANPESLAMFGGDFVFNPVGLSGEYDIYTPLEVAECGTGFMMIQRRVFEEFSKKYPETSYVADGAGSKMFCYFNGEICPDTSRYLSEDYNFCRLVRNIEMKIWVAPWICLNHLGNYKFVGNIEMVSKIVNEN